MGRVEALPIFSLGKILGEGAGTPQGVTGITVTATELLGMHQGGKSGEAAQSWGCSPHHRELQSAAPSV